MLLHPIPPPLPRSKRGTKGLFSSSKHHHHPLSCSKHETEGFSSCQPSHPPSLTQNTTEHDWHPLINHRFGTGRRDTPSSTGVSPCFNTRRGDYTLLTLFIADSTPGGGIFPPPLAFSPLSHIVRLFRRREEGYHFLHSPFQCQEGGLPPPHLIYH